MIYRSGNGDHKGSKNDERNGVEKVEGQERSNEETIRDTNGRDGGSSASESVLVVRKLTIDGKDDVKSLRRNNEDGRKVREE